MQGSGKWSYVSALFSPQCLKRTLNLFFHGAPTESSLELASKVSVHSGSNWNLEVLVFVKEGKPENPEKNPFSRNGNQQHLQPTTVPILAMFLMINCSFQTNLFGTLASSLHFHIVGHLGKSLTPFQRLKFLYKY